MLSVRVRAALVGLLVASVSAAGEPTVGTLPDVSVTMPLSDADGQNTAANVHRLALGRDDLSGQGGLMGVLDGSVLGVSFNDTQGNPHQPDVTVRGFTSSPILGTPQGLAVYLDGVKVNEAFGDVVNWDLVPMQALRSIELVPGSDPLFGLNALGGALVLSSKRGLDVHGINLEVEGGSFGRHGLQSELGAQGAQFDGYLAFEALDDGGWAEHNSSAVRQLMSKVGFRDDLSDATLSYMHASSRLNGGQTLPQSFLQAPTQSYTWPDLTANALNAVTFNGRRQLSPHWTLSGTLYWRDVQTQLLNSNVNTDFEVQSPVSEINAPTENISDAIGQRRLGSSVHLFGSERIAGIPHRVLVGVEWDRGLADFQQWSQSAGATRDTHSSAALVLGTHLQTRLSNLGALVVDTIELTPTAFLTIAGRYDHASETLDDQLGTALNGRHRFSRFNPSVGLVLHRTPTLTYYARYDESMRAPTPVELTCADPAAPCSLPNAFAADPALNPVVARTEEVGVRAEVSTRLHVRAAAFNTVSDDDIQFVSAGGGSSNLGYFRNVGRTRRRGAEIELDAEYNRLQLSMSYTAVAANFLTPFVVSSPNNASARPISCDTCTDITVQRGDRIPGVPQALFKLRTVYTDHRFGAALTLHAQDAQMARGNENNGDHRGRVAGFATVNLDSHWQVAPHWRVGLRINNLFDRRYASFGVLGRNVFTAPGNTFDASGATWRTEPFLSIGAPRGYWLTVGYRAH
jgi:outer membrane receptor protein involved in Fe transport